MNVSGSPAFNYTTLNSGADRSSAQQRVGLESPRQPVQRATQSQTPVPPPAQQVTQTEPSTAGENLRRTDNTNNLESSNFDRSRAENSETAVLQNTQEAARPQARTSDDESSAIELRRLVVEQPQNSVTSAFSDINANESRGSIVDTFV